MAKRKTAASEAEEEQKEDKRGGAQANAGRKKAKKGLGGEKVDAPKMAQSSIASLLGTRRAEPAAAPVAAPAAAAAASSGGTEELTWELARHDGGGKETLLQQRQLEGGRVRVGEGDNHPLMTLLAKGTNSMKYFADADTGEEVDKSHSNKMWSAAGLQEPS